MACIRKRVSKNGTPSWLVEIRRRGLKSVSKTFSNEDQAKAFASLYEMGACSTQKPYNLPMKVLIDRYIDEKASAKNWFKRSKYMLEYWKKNIGSIGCEDIKPSQIEHFANLLYQIKTRKGTPYSPSTRRHHIMALSACFKYAIVECGWCSKNPCVQVPLHMELINSIQKKTIDCSEQVNAFKKEFVKKLKECTSHLSITEKETMCRKAKSSWRYIVASKRNTSLPQIFKIAEIFGLDIEIKIILPNQEQTKK